MKLHTASRPGLAWLGGIVAIAALSGCTGRWSGLLGLSLVKIGKAPDHLPRPTEVPGTELSEANSRRVWLDSRHLLTREFERGFRRSDGVLEIRGPARTYVVDVRSGSRTPFPLLDRYFPEPQPGESPMPNEPSDLRAAPNGKWVLFRRNAPAPCWIALATDGSRTLRWPSSAREMANKAWAWHPDGTHWAFLTREGGLAVVMHDLRGSIGDHRLPITGLPDGVRLTQGETMGFGDARTLLVRSWSTQGPALVALRIESHRAVASLVTRVPDEEDSGLQEVRLSPNGKRLAYRTDDRTLRVSDLNGLHARDLATDVEPQSIVWHSDSHGVSYESQGVLWSVRD